MQQAATLDGQVQKRSQRGVGTEEAEEERRRGTGGAHDKYFRSPSVELWCAGQVLPRPGSGSSFHSGREGGQLQLLFQVVAAPPPHSERLTSGSGYVYELQHSTVISEVLPEASAHRGGSVAPGRTPLLRQIPEVASLTHTLSISPCRFTRCARLVPGTDPNPLLYFHLGSRLPGAALLPQTPSSPHDTPPTLCRQQAHHHAFSYNATCIPPFPTPNRATRHWLFPETMASTNSQGNRRL